MDNENTMSCLEEEGSMHDAAAGATTTTTTAATNDNNDDNHGVAVVATTEDTKSRAAEQSQPQQQQQDDNEEEDDEDDDEEEQVEVAPLKRGDLVRISQLGRRSKKSLKDRDSDALGRVTAVITPDTSCTTTATTSAATLYTVKWIVGGSSSGLQREWLTATTAEKEGFIASDNGNDGTNVSGGIIIGGGHLSRRAAAARASTQRTASPKTVSTTTATTTTTSKKKASASKAVKSKSAAKPAAKRKSIDSLSSATAAANSSKPGPTAKGKKRKLVETATSTTATDTSAAVVPTTTTVGPTTAATLTQPPISLLPSTTASSSAVTSAAATTAMNLYEKQRREFDRIVTRLEKLDKFGWFWDEVPEEFVEEYDNKKKTPSTTTMTAASATAAKSSGGDESQTTEEADAAAAIPSSLSPSTNIAVFPSHAPYNWEMIRRRREHGRYILDRVKVAEQEREGLLQPYFEWKKQQEQQRQLALQNASPDPKLSRRKRPSPSKKGLATTTTEQAESTSVNKAIMQKEQQLAKYRVLHPNGVHWDLFKSDVLAMIDAAIARQDPDDEGAGGAGGRGSLSVAAHKVREAVLQACERTGERHTREMQLADDRHFFVHILEQTPNTEAAMQSWRQSAFPERIYERLSGDVVSAGLEELDERIASYELKTSLPDCFVGLSYRYDDTGQSEAWMQSVVEETEANTMHKNKRKKLSSTSASSNNNNNNNNDKALAQKKRNEERRQTALALAAAGDGVRRAQIAATMNSLLIGVQDRVMTEWGVLKQPELRSANWLATTTKGDVNDDDHLNKDNKNNDKNDVNAVATDSKMVAENGFIISNNKDISDDSKLAENDSYPVADSEPMEVVSSNNGIMNSQEQMTLVTLDIATESCDASKQHLKGTSVVGQEGVTLSTKGKEQMETTSKAAYEAKITATASTPVHDVESGNAASQSKDSAVSAEASPEILEQPVWGIDCYTRRNISLVLESEFDSVTAMFVEKWLLPAINACPVSLAHDISNAARILEDLPFQSPGTEGDVTDQGSGAEASAEWSRTLLGNAIVEKIRTSAPPWLNAAAKLLRRARLALGADFFRVHPKGHGSIVLSQTVKPHTLVTFYRGEIYPSWRWGEKIDAIGITQERKGLKPALPDFYNMALERPQSDPRGYGMLFVDASRKAGHGSSLSHSCEPTCEVRVAAVDGRLCLAMTTLRELEMGEELTFNYNAATDSLIEYRSAVCLCGYAKCRGSFLHFATADCYQQVLNRNAPIATRFSNLIKGSTKQVMSEEDNRVLENHGFRTASFGAISVNRREGSNQGTALSDSLENIPVWLRTYAADTLRYIEYERRALPIALICGELASKDKDAADESEEAGPTSKEPTKPENGFFFFQRTQSQFLNSLLERQGSPQGMHPAIERKNAAALHWQAMSDEEKEEWKSKALADFEKRKKAWKAEQANAKKAVKVTAKTVEKVKKTKKPGIKDILANSDMQFENADAEGISAMEHRIQQLTQSLSRVGRVLDRHREGCLRSEPGTEREIEGNPELLRQLAHAPLDVMPDEKVIDWIWNREEGVVAKLIFSVKNARCTRPSLHESLAKVKMDYAQLDAFSGRTDSAGHLDPAGGRLVLKQALVGLRSVLLNELSSMAKDFRRYRSLLLQKRKTLPDDDVSENNQSLESQGNEKEGQEGTGVQLPGGQASESEGDGDGASEVISEEAAVGAVQVQETEMDVEQVKSEGPGMPIGSISHRQQMLNDNPWLAYYAERFTIQAAADVLLMYSRTTNFFVTKPYAPLMSTPIEVYARELGNAVPRSVIDEDVAASRTPRAKQPTSKKEEQELCSPDDVVAEVAVKYQPEYVVSQLLQWYNGGMGQAPGLPNLFGCVLLPFIDGCWSSELLQTNKLKAEKKTLYELKIRPRLIEWLQDPYQRGDPWPHEVQQAFAGKDCQPLSGESLLLDLPFGSPILDFLVTGDESNIHAVLEELDAGEKSAAKGDGTLLTSVDRGRPAQAVCRWVQCEDPKCLKWRKIPWHVDLDLLPEHFFCKDNKWNPTKQSCDSPEDDWDGDDKLVGNDGKVEGTPILKDGSPSKQSNFTVGARFDVMRKIRGQNKFTVATVTHIDFSGETKRVKFHFPKTSAEHDEWIPLGSKRIQALHSKTCPPQKRKSGEIQLPPNKVQKKQDDAISSQATKAESSGAGAAVVVAATIKSVEKDFEVGKKFDVLRHSGGRKKFSVGIVTAIDFEGDEKRIKFHYQKTSTCCDEWVPFGSDRIVPLHSKTSRIQKRKPEAKQPEPDTTESTSAINAEADMDIDDPVKAGDCGGVSETNIALMSCEEKTFEIGSRFDVLRKVGGRDKYLVATVSDIDSAGDQKRVKFHFRKTSANQDEWINANSPRILPLHSRTVASQKKKREAKPSARSEESIQAADTTLQNQEEDAIRSVPSHDAQHEELAPIVGISGESEKAEVTQASFCHESQVAETALTYGIPAADIGRSEADEFILPGIPAAEEDTSPHEPPTLPVNEIREFKVGRRFDVLRGGRGRFCVAKVSGVDFSGDDKRVKFHFKKTTDDMDEWITVGTNRIARLHSMTKPQQRKKNRPPTQNASSLPLQVEDRYLAAETSDSLQQSDRSNELAPASSMFYSSLENPGASQVNDSQMLSRGFYTSGRDSQSTDRLPSPENPAPSMDAPPKELTPLRSGSSFPMCGIELLAAAAEEEASPFRTSNPENPFSAARRAIEAKKIMEALERSGLSPRPLAPPVVAQSSASGTAPDRGWTNVTSVNLNNSSQFERSSLDNSLYNLAQRTSQYPLNGMNETREHQSHSSFQSATGLQHQMYHHASSDSGSGGIRHFNGMPEAQVNNNIGMYRAYGQQGLPAATHNHHQVQPFASLPQTNAGHNAPYNHFGSGLPLALTPLLRRGGQGAPGSHPSYQQYGPPQGQGHRYQP